MYGGVKTFMLALALGVIMSVAVLLGMSSNAMAQRQIIRLEEIQIEGRIQKPEAFYILQRSSLHFKSVKLTHSFIPKIVQSVDTAPWVHEH